MSAAGVVDCERHVLLSSLDQVTARVEPAWVARMTESEFRLPPPGPHPGVQVEGGAVDGGDDPAAVAASLPADSGPVLLVAAQAIVTSGWLNVATAETFVRAVNDHVLETWLPADPRFRFAPVLAPHDPEHAAAEIRRLGPNPAVAAVCMPLMAINMGQPHYHPIYAAAEEQGLPLMVHPGGGEGNVVGPPVLGGVGPRTPEETFSLLPQVAMSNLSSILFDGIFLRFPALRVIFAGFGFAWAPPVLWRADSEWRGLRVEVPWLTKAPSEYAAEHVRLVLDGSAELPAGELERLLALIPQQMLLYGSDAPFAEVDVLAAIEALPDELSSRILVENAFETLRLSG
ncbi:MAG: amidohydrolase family protein [Solirubrobacterales bacterium]